MNECYYKSSLIKISEAFIRTILGGQKRSLLLSKYPGWGKPHAIHSRHSNNLTLQCHKYEPHTHHSLSSVAISEHLQHASVAYLSFLKAFKFLRWNINPAIPAGRAYSPRSNQLPRCLTRDPRWPIPCRRFACLPHPSEGWWRLGGATKRGRPAQRDNPTVRKNSENRCPAVAEFVYISPLHQREGKCRGNRCGFAFWRLSLFPAGFLKLASFSLCFQCGLSSVLLTCCHWAGESAQTVRRLVSAFQCALRHSHRLSWAPSIAVVRTLCRSECFEPPSIVSFVSEQAFGGGNWDAYYFSIWLARSYCHRFSMNP